MNFSLSKGPDTKAAAPSMNALKTTGAPMFGAAPAAPAAPGSNNANNLSGLDGLL